MIFKRWRQTYMTPHSPPHPYGHTGLRTHKHGLHHEHIQQHASVFMVEQATHMVANRLIEVMKNGTVAVL